MTQEQGPGLNPHYNSTESLVEAIRSAPRGSQEKWRLMDELARLPAPLSRKAEEDWYKSRIMMLGGAFAFLTVLAGITDHFYSANLVSSSFVRPVRGESGQDIYLAPSSPTPQPSNHLEDREDMQGLKLYTEDGARFRRKVLFAQISGSPDGNMDIASYNHWKSFLGYEVFKRGIIKVVEGHQVGDIVIVEDYVPPKGIFLRKSPSLRFDSGKDPYTYQGDTLRIVGGPQDLIDKQRREAWRMWRVQRMRWNGRTLGWQPTKEDAAVGWIWQEWLGPKHWLYEGPSLADQSRFK